MYRLILATLVLISGMAMAQTIPDYRITSTRKYAGTYPLASVNVRQIGLNPALKPVIFVEGFDIFNTDDLNALQNNLQSPEANLKQSLLDQGYTLFIVDFANSQDYIQSNAMALIDVFNDCWERSLKREPIKVIGVSMGGIVAQYALARAENLELDHHCNLYVSFDAPHKGANMPVSVQLFIAFFADMNDDAKQFKAIMNSPAASQLLIFNGFVTNRPQLEFEMAWLGYPRKTRNVAITNGMINGTRKGIGDYKQAITWNLDGPAYYAASARLYTDPYNYRNGDRAFYGSRTNSSGKFSATTNFSGNQPSYDDAPGGYFNAFEILDSKLNITKANFKFFGYTVSLNASSTYANPIPEHSFVPTISALDIKDLDVTKNANLELDMTTWPDLASHTPFARVFYPSYSSINEHHGRLTPQNMQFILEEIRKTTKTGLSPAVLSLLLQ